MWLLGVYVSRDVIFDEQVFPFSKLHPNAGALLRSQVLLLPPSLLNSSSINHEGQQIPGPNMSNTLLNAHENSEFFGSNSDAFDSSLQH